MVPTPSATLLPSSFKIVFYKDKSATTPIHHECSWEDIVSGLTKFEESPCTIDGPKRCVGKDVNSDGCEWKSKSKVAGEPMCWSPVIIHGERLKENVEKITLLVLDLDHLTKETALQVIAEKLAGYELVWHTTHGNRADDICFRAVLPLSRPVTSAAWPRFRQAAVKMFDVPADPKTKSLAQMYFRPSHPQGAPHAQGRVQGRVLDVDAVLTWADANLPPDDANTLVERGANAILGGYRWDLEGDAVVGAIALLVKHYPNKRRRDTAMALDGYLVRRGTHEDDRRYLIREVGREGGSTRKDFHVDVVNNTASKYEAGEALPGFERLCEILGEEVAKEFGDLVADADNEAFLRNVKRAPSKKSFVETSVEVLPPKVVDIKALYRKLQSFTQRKSKSLIEKDRITATVLKRMLRGDALTNGAEDKEVGGISYTDAIKTAMKSIAFTLPLDTPWEAVYQISSRGLNATAEFSFESARKIFNSAQASKEMRDAKREIEITERREKIRADLIAASGDDSAPNKPLDGDDWQSKLETDQKNRILPSIQNAALMMRNHPDLCGHIRWNELTKEIEIHGGPFKGFPKWRIATAIQDHLAQVCGISVKNTRDLKERIYVIARENPYEPIQEYLRSLKWDGVDRLDTWLFDYAGAIYDDDEERVYVSAIGRRWLIGAAARALIPGCKCDTMLTFESSQGAGKSTLLRILGGSWFSDTELDLKNKDSRLVVGSKWIVEMAELNGFKTAADTTRKAFLSQEDDVFRPPYEAGLETAKRRAIFCGTTNQGQYLTDESGNRRYWAVRASTIDNGKLRRDRDQLLAEAAHLVLSAETCDECAHLQVHDTSKRCDTHRWWLTNEENFVAERQADKRMEEIPYMLKIHEWWIGTEPTARPRYFDTDELAVKVLDFERTRIDDKLRQKIGYAMKKLSFDKKRISKHGVQHWFYVPTAEQLNMPYEKPAELIRKQTPYTAAVAATKVLQFPTKEIVDRP